MKQILEELSVNKENLTENGARRKLHSNTGSNDWAYFASDCSASTSKRPVDFVEAENGVQYTMPDNNGYENADVEYISKVEPKYSRGRVTSPRQSGNPKPTRSETGRTTWPST